MMRRSRRQWRSDHGKGKGKAKKAKAHPKNKWIVVRHSRVHGYGCFARRFIPKGTRIIEYLGERMSHKEADRRYDGADVNDNHTFLFIADRKTVIDASNGGNEARFINHSCDGNCESEIEKSRVFIDAIKDIPKGAELGYDYQIGRDRSDPANVDKIYACRCGSANCRGLDVVATHEGVPSPPGGAPQGGSGKEGEEVPGREEVPERPQIGGQQIGGQEDVPPSRMKLSAVVAASDNDVIGRGNALPWHLPADLAHFKQLTLGKPILMGRMTFEAIGRPLPGRRNLVLSRGGFAAPGVETVSSLDAARAAVAGEAELMIIGGAQLYRQALPVTDTIHLTRVHCRIEGDAHLPPLSREQWREVAREERAADERNAHAMTFITLERVRP